MARFVGLLRGINVGGKHKLPMAELRTHFEAAGARAVQTYIQSGNVVFEAAARQGPELGAAVAESLEAAKGFAVPIVVRTAAAWQSAIDDNPYAAEAEGNPKRVHAMLLSRAPTKAARAAFDPDCRMGERWTLGKDILYIDAPNGTARSKLGTPYVDRVLECIATARNWRTMLTLQAKLDEA